MNPTRHAQDTHGAWQSDLPRGAHLTTQRPGYVHDGIFIGDGKVIHYAGLSRRLSRGPVEIVSVEQFAGGSSLKVIFHRFAEYTGLEVVRRASRLGQCEYCLLTNNASTFACGAGSDREEASRSKHVYATRHTD